MSNERQTRLKTVLIGSLVLLIAVTAGWLFRPLSSEERQLVGTWRLGEFGDITFRSNRTVDASQVEDPYLGRWKLHRGTLTLYDCDELGISWMARVKRRLLHTDVNPAEDLQVRFVDAETMEIRSDSQCIQCASVETWHKL